MNDLDTLGPGALLVSVGETFDFQGGWTDPSIEAMVEWATMDDYPIQAVHVVLGQPGSGKTRLARELKGRLREIGWTICEAGDIESVADDVGPVLIVFDTPNLPRERLMSAGHVFKARQRAGRRTRILALARIEDSSWPRLPASLGVIMTEPDTTPILPAAHKDECYEGFAIAAAHAFAERLGLGEPKGPLVASWDSSIPIPLHLLAIGLLGALGITSQGQDDGAEGIDAGHCLHRLAELEQESWQQRLKAANGPKVPPEDLWRAVAALNLIDPDDFAEAPAIIARVAPDEMVPRLVEALALLFPGPGREGRIAPRGLADHIVIDALAGDEELAGRILDPKSLRGIRASGSAIRLLGRYAFDHGFAEARDHPLWEAIRAVVEAQDHYSLAEAEEIGSLIPEERSPIDRHAAWLLEIVLPRLGDDAPPEALARFRCAAAARLADHLVNDGLALDTVDHALKSMAKLHGRRPTLYEFDYALALADAATAYELLDELEKALDCAEKACAIHEALARKDLVEHCRRAADLYDRAAEWWWELDQPKKAIKASEKAIKACRRIAKHDPEDTAIKIMGVLARLEGWLVDLGDIEEAIKANDRLIDHLTTLVEAHPKRFERALLLAIGNKGKFCSAQGRREEALRHAKAVVEGFEPLFLTDGALETRRSLALSLNQLAECHASLDDLEEAILTVARSLELVESDKVDDEPNPVACQAMMLAMALFLETDRPNEALPMADGAIAELMKAVDDHDQEVFADLAMVHLIKASLHLDAGQLGKARAAGEKSIRFYREPGVEDIEEYEEKLAAAVGIVLAIEKRQGLAGPSAGPGRDLGAFGRSKA